MAKRNSVKKNREQRPLTPVTPKLVVLKLVAIPIKGRKNPSNHDLEYIKCHYHRIRVPEGPFFASAYLAPLCSGESYVKDRRTKNSDFSCLFLFFLWTTLKNSDLDQASSFCEHVRKAIREAKKKKKLYRVFFFKLQVTCVYG